MPPYENQSMHDMHGLLQQLDTLNAGHAPEHLEWPSLPSIRDIKDQARAGAKKVSDTANAASKKAQEMYNGLASEEEVILHAFSNTPDEQKKEQMGLLLVSNEIRDKYTHLLEIMVKSPTFKPIIMQEWYPSGIKEPLQREVYAKMHPPKK